MPRKIEQGDLKISTDKNIKVGDLYSLKEWADKVGCSYEWLKNKMKEGLCEVVKIGNNYFVIDNQFNRNVFVNSKSIKKFTGIKATQKK